MRKFKCGSEEEPDTRCQIGPGQMKTVTPAERVPSQMHSSHQLCFPVLGIFWGTPLSERFCTVKPTPSEGTQCLRVLEPCEKEAWPHLQRHSTPGFLLLPIWTVCVFNCVPFPAAHLVCNKQDIGASCFQRASGHPHFTFSHAMTLKKPWH